MQIPAGLVVARGILDGPRHYPQRLSIVISGNWRIFDDWDELLRSAQHQLERRSRSTLDAGELEPGMLLFSPLKESPVPPSFQKFAGNS